MNKFIKRTNQYLLERYPTIWNTKIVWMLAIAIVVHIIFYLLGFSLLTNSDLLKERGASTLFFENGTIFFSIMISIITLVVWLSQLFKNNGFKSFYPTSRLKLFGQFFQYFIIILACSTFYFSYMFGVKHYVNFKYEDSEFIADVDASNKAAVFFSHSLSDYTISNRRYPEPFDTSYCEVRDQFIDENEDYITFLGNNYQYYSLKSEFKSHDNFNYRNNSTEAHAFRTAVDSGYIYYYKDKVIGRNDLTINYTNTANDSISIAEPSYFNFAKDFYEINNNNSSYFNRYSYSVDRDELSPKNIKNNKANYNLLIANDDNEISKTLQDFLDVSDKHDIKRNIDLEQWKSLIYQDKGFKVKALIHDEKPSEVGIRDTKEKTEYQKYIASLHTNYFIETEKLFYVFGNIDDIKNTVVLNETVHVFLWIAFFIACIIFVFRVTNIKVFIFSIVAAALLLIFTSLTLVFINYVSDYQGSKYFSYYFCIVLGLIILLIPLLFSESIRKGVSGTLMNLSIVGFPLLILGIISVINEHQRDACNILYTKYADCKTIMSYLEINTSYILLFVGFAFVFFYSEFIKKWRALPEK